jgi:malate/lactate dehydrogenase
LKRRCLSTGVQPRRSFNVFRPEVEWIKGQVIGTGTLLDSVRLGSALSEEIQVSVGFRPILSLNLHVLTRSLVADADNDAYVLGEHGDVQIVRPLLQRLSVSSFLMNVSPSGRMVNFNNHRSSHPNPPPP